MNKKITLGLALSLVAIASAVTFILTSFFTLQSFNKKIVDVNEKSKKYSSLNNLDAYFREHYYGEIDEAELNSGILKGYASGTGDKYARYLTAEEYAAELASEEGEQIGLGLTLTEDVSGYIRITDVLPDSPAADEGVQPDDIIVKIDGVDVLETGVEEALESMNGNEGSTLKLTLRRSGIDTDYTFTRRSIELQSVTGEMMSNYIGYIRIRAFRKNTPEQFMDVLGRLTANGAKALIFDLRDNTGGIIKALEECLDPLLPEGVIATAEYKDGHTETIVYSDESKLDLPMVVLVNKNTASAAELFAASLRDFRRSQLIGTKTYGKGVMQETAEFDNGGAVVLTVAKCRTTVSESFNGVGLVPDTIIENTDENTDSQLIAAQEAIIMTMTQQ